MVQKRPNSRTPADPAHEKEFQASAEIKPILCLIVI